MKRNNRGLLSCRRCGWKYTKLSKLPAYIKKTTIICFATLIQRLEIKPNKLFYASTFFFPILPVYLSLLYCFLFFFSSFNGTCQGLYTENKKKKIYTVSYTTVKSSNIFKKFLNETSIQNAIIKCRIGKLPAAPN